MQSGTTNTTKTLTTSTPRCIIGVMAAEKENGKKCLHHPEIIHPREEEDEAKRREVAHHIIPHLCLHQLLNPALKS